MLSPSSSGSLSSLQRKRQWVQLKVQNLTDSVVRRFPAGIARHLRRATPVRRFAAALTVVGVLTALALLLISLASHVKVGTSKTAPAVSAPVATLDSAAEDDGGLEADLEDTKAISEASAGSMSRSWVLEIERRVGLVASDPVRKDELLSKRIQLTIVTIATHVLMPNVREFVGWTHRYCPRCTIIVFNYDLTPSDVREIHMWEHVEVRDVYRSLMSASGHDILQAIHIPAMALYHTIVTLQHHRAIFIDVRYCLSRGANKIDEHFQENGHVFAVEGPDESRPTIHVMGFSREHKISLDFLKQLVSPEACNSDMSTGCVYNRRLWVPVVVKSELQIALQWKLPTVESLGINPQNLADSIIRMSIPSEANANTDIRNLAFDHKAYHTELEMYAHTHMAYVRFDLSEVTGDIVSAELKVHNVWLAEDGHGVSTKAAQFRISRVDDNLWEEQMLWKSRPLRTHDQVVATTRYRTDSVVDVTQAVRNAHVAASADSRKLVSFELATDVAMWVKFASRRSVAPDHAPVLVLRIRGQGLGYRHIHPHNHHISDNIV